MHKIAIFGFGGRCVNLLLELVPWLPSDDYVEVVAIYDNAYNQVMAALSADKRSRLSLLLSKVKIYSNDIPEKQVYLENDFDTSFICSPNYKHYESILLACQFKKNIFCEKPLVHKLDHLFDIREKLRDYPKFFQTGLTLRYAKMISIILEHLPKIGQPKKIYGREFVNIGHGRHIMIGWRRYQNLSGGMGLEKVVHDYDLLTYLIEQAFHINIDHIEISGISQKLFWLKNRENEIMEHINRNPELSKCYYKWDTRIHQTLVASPFENLDCPDIIPDYQKIRMNFLDADLELEFEVSIGGYRVRTERWYQFDGPNGSIVIDIMTNNMNVKLINQNYQVNLETDGTSHAGGDPYIMKTFLELLDNGEIKQMPSLIEAIRSTHLGLLCELSIRNKSKCVYNKF